MISTLRGEVLEINNDNLIINLSGLGIACLCSRICLSNSKNGRTDLFTYPSDRSGRCFDAYMVLIFAKSGIFSSSSWVWMELVHGQPWQFFQL